MIDQIRQIKFGILIEQVDYVIFFILFIFFSTRQFE